MMVPLQIKAMNKGEKRLEKPAISYEITGSLYGAGYRSRTGDLLITSQLLYQLS